MWNPSRLRVGAPSVQHLHLPFAQVMENIKMCYHHSYADDTYIYITIPPGDYNPVQILTECNEQINDWMSQNVLQLNKDKTEVCVLETGRKDLKVSAWLESVKLKTSKQARNPVVVTDSDLNFNSHINTITKSSHYHLRNTHKRT